MPQLYVYMLLLPLKPLSVLLIKLFLYSIIYSAGCHYSTLFFFLVSVDIVIIDVLLFCAL